MTHFHYSILDSICLLKRNTEQQRKSPSKGQAICWQISEAILSSVSGHLAQEQWLFTILISTLCTISHERDPFTKKPF